MTTETEPTFSLDESIALQKAMRDKLGLPQEQFALPEFIGMVSDEIEQLRDSGMTDAAIAAMITERTGKPFPAEAIAAHYVGPDDRHFGHQ